MSNEPSNSKSVYNNFSSTNIPRHITQNFPTKAVTNPLKTHILMIQFLFPPQTFATSIFHLLPKYTSSCSRVNHGHTTHLAWFMGRVEIISRSIISILRSLLRGNRQKIYRCKYRMIKGLSSWDSGIVHRCKNSGCSRVNDQSCDGQIMRRFFSINTMRKVNRRSNKSFHFGQLRSKFLWKSANISLFRAKCTVLAQRLLLLAIALRMTHIVDVCKLAICLRGPIVDGVEEFRRYGSRVRRLIPDDRLIRLHRGQLQE